MAKSNQTFQEFRTSVMKLVAESNLRPGPNRQNKNGDTIFVVGRRELRKFWKAGTSAFKTVHALYE